METYLNGAGPDDSDASSSIDHTPSGARGVRGRQRGRPAARPSASSSTGSRTPTAANGVSTAAAASRRTAKRPRYLDDYDGEVGSPASQPARQSLVADGAGGDAEKEETPTEEESVDTTTVAASLKAEDVLYEDEVEEVPSDTRRGGRGTAKGRSSKSTGGGNIPFLVLCGIVRDGVRLGASAHVSTSCRHNFCAHITQL